jgi:hypothetical protein
MLILNFPHPLYPARITTGKRLRGRQGGQVLDITPPVQAVVVEAPREEMGSVRHAD